MIEMKLNIIGVIMNSKLKPLLKYPGGKTSELDLIFDNLPNHINNYIEPFVGGGAVYFALGNTNKNYINDKSEELILLYKYVKNNSKAFFDELTKIIENWDKLTELASDIRLMNLYLRFREDKDINISNDINTIVNEKIDDIPMFNLRDNIKFEKYLSECIIRRINLIKKNEVRKGRELEGEELKNNLEAGIKSAYYTYLRDVYNNTKEYNRLSKQRKVAIYLFIREYCYSSMFRFNREGEFNVPYGGVSYNKKSLINKLEYYKSKDLKKLLKNTIISQNDFYDFVKSIEIKNSDFMFLDPPYDTTFNEYDKNIFGMEDQIRLANYLINECKCHFMLVIKKTDFIESLYVNKGLRILEQDKSYFVSFKNRNEKKVKHLIIMNYKGD